MSEPLRSQTLLRWHCFVLILLLFGFRAPERVAAQTHGRSAPRGYGVMVAQSGIVRFFGHEVSGKRLVLFPPGCEIEAVGSPGLSLVHYVLPTDRITATALDWQVDLVEARQTLIVEPGIDRLHHLETTLDRVSGLLEDGDMELWPEIEKDLVETFLGIFDRAAFGDKNPSQPHARGVEYAMQGLRHLCLQPFDQQDLDSLARKLGIGRHHLNRCFREHYGTSIQEFAHLCRLHQARALLMVQTPELSVTDAAYSCRFNHLGRFFTEYRQLFGETPRQTLRQAAATT